MHAGHSGRQRGEVPWEPHKEPSIRPGHRHNPFTQALTSSHGNEDLKCTQSTPPAGSQIDSKCRSSTANVTRVHDCALISLPGTAPPTVAERGFLAERGVCDSG